MADAKISALSSGAPAQSGDEYIVARSGANYKLTLANIAASMPETTISVNSASDALRITQTGAGNALVVEDSANPDATPFVVNASGNVGIGTTAPQAVLDLGSGSSGRALTWSGSASTRYASIFTAFSAADIVLGYGFHGSTSADSYLSSWTGTLANAGVRVGTGTVRFFTNTATAQTAGNAFTPTERMRIDSSGNVGIGTTSPSKDLQVSFSDSTTTDLNSGAGILINNIDTTTGTLAPLLFSTDSGGRVRSAISHVDTGAYGKGDLAFYTMADGDISGAVIDTGDEKMRITSAGQLLVGNTSARANLFNGSVSANFQVEGTTLAGSSSLNVINSTSDYPFHAFARSRGTTIGSNTLVADDDVVGQVIGMGSDGTQFVQCASINFVIDGTPGANDMPGRIEFNTTADNSTSTVERMRLTSAGELLVGGTTAINAASGFIGLERANGGCGISLFRNDTSISTGNIFGSIDFYGNDTTANAVTLHARITAVASGTHAAGDNPTDITFGTTASGSATIAETMRLTGAGSLGIGTASPGQKLEVAGNVRLSGSQVGSKIENRHNLIVVTTSATNILDNAGSFGRLVVVNGESGSNRFCDLVLASTSVSPTVVSSFTAQGSPAARTYTRNGVTLELAMASGTYNVWALALGY